MQDQSCLKIDVEAGAQAVTLDATQFAMLLDGIDVARVERQC